MFRLVVLVVAITSCNAFPRALNPKLQRIDGRIIGGNETTIEEHPWQVSLRYRTYGNHYCGGVLISKDTVVTAAFCAEEIKIGLDKVVVGTSRLSEVGIQFDVASFVVNDQYNLSTLSNDIAVLKLQGEVKLSDSVQIAKLPEQGKTVADGTEVTVTGWGTENENEYVLSDILREVKVNIVGKKECEKAYPGQLTETMICAGVPDGGKDACEGDSGGPLTVGDTLYGIVSWGNGCAEPGYPGVYTDIANQRNWIKENSGV